MLPVAIALYHEGRGVVGDSLLWSLELGTPVIAPPAVVGNTLYLAGYNGYLYALVPGIK